MRVCPPSVMVDVMVKGVVPCGVPGVTVGFEVLLVPPLQPTTEPAIIRAKAATRS